MMNKKRVLTSLVLGTAVASQVAMPVFAKEQKNDSPNGTAEWQQDAHTTIGILEATEDDAGTANNDKINVSFEVPLYVTTAAVEKDAKLRTPTTYNIKNNGDRGIVVTGMNFETLKGSTWTTVNAEKDISTTKQVVLSIGGVPMPVISAAGTKEVVNLKDNKADAFTTADNKYNVIAAKADNTPGALSKSEGNTGKVGVTDDGVVIAGRVKADTRSSEKAAAQFKVTYIVSAIKDGVTDGAVDNSQIVGYTYVGDDKTQALLK